MGAPEWTFEIIEKKTFVVNSFLEEDQGVAENEPRRKFMVPKDFLLELIRTGQKPVDTKSQEEVWL